MIIFKCDEVVIVTINYKIVIDFIHILNAQLVVSNNYTLPDWQQTTTRWRRPQIQASARSGLSQKFSSSLGVVPIFCVTCWDDHNNIEQHTLLSELKASWIILCNQHNAQTTESCCSLGCRRMRRQHKCNNSAKNIGHKKYFPISTTLMQEAT